MFRFPPDEVAPELARFCGESVELREPLELAAVEEWCLRRRGTVASGNGLRRSAASASPVTQTGVCELPRE